MILTKRRVTWIAACLLAAVSSAWMSPAEAENVSIVDAGKARAVIVLPAEPSALERKASDELVQHVKLIAGADLSVVTGDQDPGPLTPIRLGGAADPSLADTIRGAGGSASAFALVVDANGIAIRGMTDEGTLFGVYELLEQLGVRWYHPGDLGRVLPDADTLTLAHQRTIQTPSMTYRKLQHVHVGDWPQRVRLGGAERSTGAHGIPPFNGGRLGQRLFEEDPKYYALVNGQRKKAQLCLSNPDVLRLAVQHLRERLAASPGLKYVGMGPNDGGGYCECENCKALDRGVYDPLIDGISMTDRYIWFFNQLLDELEADYPDLHLVWYVYAYHMMPPAIAPNPRIVGSFAPITLDRIRGMDNPNSPDRHILRWVIDEWAKTGPNEMGYRGYYNNLACPSFPISQIDRIRHEIPVFHEKGITAMRIEVILPAWSMQTPSLYLSSRMMWDVNTDVDALLNEFYKLYYGPAESPMKQYHEMLESAFRDTSYFTGSSYVYFPLFLHHPRREKMRGLLDDAATAVPDDSIYAERLRAVRLGWNRMEAFLDMIEARNRHDYKTAHEKMAVFYGLTDEMVGYVLDRGENERDDHAQRLLYWPERANSPKSYFNRFFSQAVKAGYERTVAQGDLVAPLPDEWDFLLDPTGLGEMSGYQRPGKLGGNWQPMKTTSRSWSDQGLHYYKGVAWYRKAVKIPADFKGRQVYLWFGGVDELATVWVNGVPLGSNAKPLDGLPGVPGSFRPFDLHATPAIRFGEENWIVVRITNEKLSELGTGGIVAPVMFWSPRDPNWKP